MADITRADVASLIQESYANDVIGAAMATSVALNAFPNVNMGTKTHNLPVLATQPVAKWVGESATAPEGVKPQSKQTWGNKQLVAEELAVIIPVHENVVDDATADIITSIATEGGKAIGFALDAATIFGTNKPVSWTSADLFAAATAAGQLQQVGTATGDDLSGSILQAAELLADAGFDPDVFIARRGLKYQLANQRATDGTPIYMGSLDQASVPGAMSGTVHGLNSYWATGQVDDGAGGTTPVWDPTVATGIIADSSRVRIGVRQDITVKFLDQATVGDINLAERDMIALRFKARYAYVLADGLTNEGVGKVPVAAVTPTPPAP